MEENTNNNPEKLFLKYFFQAIEKQQQDRPIDFSKKLTEQLSTKDLLLELYKHQEYSVLTNSPSSPDINPVGGYSDRRRKNNEAAKRSRDARRVKEDEIALRATWLEQENVRLRLENTHLKQENLQLRCQIYNSTKS